MDSKQVKNIARAVILTQAIARRDLLEGLRARVKEQLPRGLVHERHYTGGYSDAINGVLAIIDETLERCGK